MPKRTDLQTILIIGSGPIVIGQGCEFDYSGTQACKALREEGYRIVLVNSNPATIMTDPEFADRTYIEPILPGVVAKIIEREHGGPYQIDALLSTLGGQTALNCACNLADDGVLEAFGVEMIGATREVIYRAEDREQFSRTMASIGLETARHGVANSLSEAFEVLEKVGLPAIIRPAFTLGGTGGGVAYDRDEFETIVRRGLDASMNRQILIDQSLLGWKEYELEVMRDREDNVVIVCSIENLDPMGVHTGDSITVAPAQTLTDKEYQRMRDAAMAVIRAVGVETGGSNIQFAINPAPGFSPGSLPGGHQPPGNAVGDGADRTEPGANGAGQMIVVEMNPRVSRSSALASKATGFPIAKIATKLAVGYTLWELPNDITGKTVACFEPTIDYVVTKIPRWTFEKFPEADERLTIQMKSVGEVMSIGRTFKESLQKGIRSMEVKRNGLGLDTFDAWLNARRLAEAPARAATALVAAGTDAPAQPPDNRGPRPDAWPIDPDILDLGLRVPTQDRMFHIRYAFKMGYSIEQVYGASRIDPWFLDQFKQLVDFEDVLVGYKRLEEVPHHVLFQAKQWGYSDAQLAHLYLGRSNLDTIMEVRRHRQSLQIPVVYKLVDTCAAEFEAATPYYYSTYESPITRVTNGKPVHYDNEIRVSDKPKIVILGSGPNRIGQGIEFDYCCVQAAFAADELGFESVMINSNPETVSTDYDTSDLLFFEPLAFEDVLNVCERLNGAPLRGPGRLLGVIVQFGGQTPLNLAEGLETAGVPIIGTRPRDIHVAEDREAFGRIIRELGLRQPANGVAYDFDGAKRIAAQIGYPVLVRPSYVLGGRAMEICNIESDLERYMHDALAATDRVSAADTKGHPVLIDGFLKNAVEVDVDCVADHGDAVSDGRCVVCGVMEHIEEAGVHSGDSSCALPPYSLSPAIVDELKDQAARLADRLNVCGLMNVQFAIKDNTVYVLEVNPRASRTVPFVSKATGVPWAKVATKVMAGERLSDLMERLGLTESPSPAHVSVKESVFPFAKFPNVDVILGPEMRSTGEVMGIDATFGEAFAKSQMAAGASLPVAGNVLVSVNDDDKPHIGSIGRSLAAMGFTLFATVGTRAVLATAGVEAELVSKTSGDAPYLLELITTRQLQLLINTPLHIGSTYDEAKWRAAAVRYNIPLVTTITGARAAVSAISAQRAGPSGIRSLQEYHRLDEAE